MYVIFLNFCVIFQCIYHNWCNQLPLKTHWQLLLVRFFYLTLKKISDIVRASLGFLGSSSGKESTCNAGESPVRFLSQEEPLEKGEAAHSTIHGLPWWLREWRICLWCGRPVFDPWVGKSPRRRERLPTPVLLPGASQGQGRVRHGWVTMCTA